MLRRSEKAGDRSRITSVSIFYFPCSFPYCLLKRGKREREETTEVFDVEEGPIEMKVSRPRVGFRERDQGFEGEVVDTLDKGPDLK